MLPFQVHQHKEPFVVSGHCETEKASQVSERNVRFPNPTWRI